MHQVCDVQNIFVSLHTAIYRQRCFKHVLFGEKNNYKKTNCFLSNRQKHCVVVVGTLEKKTFENVLKCYTMLHIVL